MKKYLGILLLSLCFLLSSCSLINPKDFKINMPTIDKHSFESEIIDICKDLSDSYTANSNIWYNFNIESYTGPVEGASNSYEIAHKEIKIVGSIRLGPTFFDTLLHYIYTEKDYGDPGQTIEKEVFWVEGVSYTKTTINQSENSEVTRERGYDYNALFVANRYFSYVKATYSPKLIYNNIFATLENELANITAYKDGNRYGYTAKYTKNTQNYYEQCAFKYDPDTHLFKNFDLFIKDSYRNDESLLRIEIDQALFGVIIKPMDSDRY